MRTAKFCEVTTIARFSEPHWIAVVPSAGIIDTTSRWWSLKAMDIMVISEQDEIECQREND